MEKKDADKKNDDRKKDDDKQERRQERQRPSRRRRIESPILPIRSRATSRASPTTDKSPALRDAPPPGEQQQGEGQSGQPSDAESNPAQKRLEQAKQRMQEAQQKLDEAKREDAKEKQAEAIKELEQAKADLEEILRQLREEEMSRTLAMLETRFRKMLDQQVEVYEGTKRVDKTPQAERDRDDEIEAGRLSRKESQIATEADKALAVLREEGSAVAFPEAVDGDARRHGAGRRAAGPGQGGRRDARHRDRHHRGPRRDDRLAAKSPERHGAKEQAGPAPPSGEQDEPPLVDTLSELKMIRALQMRVNVRTERYAEMTKTEQTDKPELLEALKRLAEREAADPQGHARHRRGEESMSSMQSICRVRLAWLHCCAVALATGAAAEAAQSRPGQEFAQKASWKVPTPQSVRDLAMEWLATRELDARRCAPARNACGPAPRPTAPTRPCSTCCARRLRPPIRRPRSWWTFARSRVAQIALPDVGLADGRKDAARGAKQSAIGLRPLAGARVVVRRGGRAACRAEAGRRGRSGGAVVLSGRRASSHAWHASRAWRRFRGCWKTKPRFPSDSSRWRG